MKGKGICLESRYPCNYTCSSDFTSPCSGRTAACNYWSNFGSVHRVPIMAGWTKAVWNTKFAQHLHMASNGNWIPDLLILSPTPYPLGHMLLLTSMYILLPHQSRLLYLIYLLPTSAVCRRSAPRCSCGVSLATWLTGAHTLNGLVAPNRALSAVTAIFIHTSRTRICGRI